jgi:hypothetical protein
MGYARSINNRLNMVDGISKREKKREVYLLNVTDVNHQVP